MLNSSACKKDTFIANLWNGCETKDAEIVHLQDQVHNAKKEIKDLKTCCTKIKTRAKKIVGGKQSGKTPSTVFTINILPAFIQGGLQFKYGAFIRTNTVYPFRVSSISPTCNKNYNIDCESIKTNHHQAKYGHDEWGSPDWQQHNYTWNLASLSTV